MRGIVFNIVFQIHAQLCCPKTFPLLIFLDDAAPWAFLAQRMVTEAVSTRTLDDKYPTTKELGKVIKFNHLFR